jgi:hypothetical protein
MDRNEMIENIDNKNNINNINIFSSISCNDRNNYDKNFCEGLNKNKINNFLKPYINNGIGNDSSYFQKNEYFLENEGRIINNTSKEDCSINCIENNYQGFKYEGDKNKCLLFSSTDNDNKIRNSLGNYSVKTFLKSKNTIDIDNIEDQLYSKNYFTEYNNYGYMPKDLIKTFVVESKDQCMDYCVKDFGKCKSILYAEQPKKCTFYKNKIIKNKKETNENYDIYTIKKNKVDGTNDIINSLKDDYVKNGVENDNYYYCNLNNDKCVLDYKLKNEYIQNINSKEQDNNIEKPILYDCSGFYSTNPFCTKEYDPSKDDLDTRHVFDNYSDCFNKKGEENIDKLKKIYTKECKQKYGNEYEFDDDKYNLNNVMEYDNNTKRVKCKMNFNSDNLILEKFSNNDENTENNNYFMYIFLFIIFIIIVNFLILSFT